MALSIAVKDDGETELARLSVSLPSPLLAQLDLMTSNRGNGSRSQTVAELIRQELAQHGRRLIDSVIAGTITLVYRTESGRVRHALAQTQLAYLKEVISSQHVFLEEDHSLEVLLVQGPAERLQQLCDDLRGIRSVEQIKLVTTSSLLPPLHVAHDPKAALTTAPAAPSPDLETSTQARRERAAVLAAR